MSAAAGAVRKSGCRQCRGRPHAPLDAALGGGRRVARAAVCLSARSHNSAGPLPFRHCQVWIALQHSAAVTELTDKQNRGRGLGPKESGLSTASKRSSTELLPGPLYHSSLACPAGAAASEGKAWDLRRQARAAQGVSVGRRARHILSCDSAGRRRSLPRSHKASQTHLVLSTLMRASAFSLARALPTMLACRGAAGVGNRAAGVDAGSEDGRAAAVEARTLHANRAVQQGAAQRSAACPACHPACHPASPACPGSS